MLATPFSPLPSPDGAKEGPGHLVHQVDFLSHLPPFFLSTNVNPQAQAQGGCPCEDVCGPGPLSVTW